MSDFVDENENIDTGEPVTDISQFEFIKDSFLGKGQYGSTYKARFGGVVVAVKEPFRNELHENEIDMLKNVRHKNIVRYIDCLFIKNKFCIIMELAENGNLYTIIHNQSKCNIPLTSDLKDKWTNEVACGLHYLHTGLEYPILHGDVKSPNVLIFQAPHYTAKLSDFGLSEEMLEGTYSVKGEGSYTAPWAAPEAVRSKRTTKSDIWSFGALVWEILMEKIPFSKFSDQLAILFAVGNGTSPYDPKVDQIPEKYRPLLNNCFSVDHTKRWSFKQICRYLEEFDAENGPQDEAKPVVSEMEKCDFPPGKSKQESYIAAFNRFGQKLQNADLLRRVKFLFKDKIPTGVRDRIKDGYELLETLEKCGCLSADSTDFVRERLALLTHEDDKLLAQIFYEDCSIEAGAEFGPVLRPGVQEMCAGVAVVDAKTVEMRGPPPCERMSSDVDYRAGDAIERNFIREKEGRLARQDGDCSSVDLPLGVQDGETNFYDPSEACCGQISKIVNHSEDMEFLFDIVSNEVSKHNFRTLGRHLFGGKEHASLLDEIEKNTPDQRYRTFRMLQMWEDSLLADKCEATCEKLVSVLKSAKLERTASVVERFMPCPQ